MAINLKKGYEELHRLWLEKSTDTLNLVAYGPGIPHNMAIEDPESNTVILSFDAFEEPIPHIRGYVHPVPPTLGRDNGDGRTNKRTMEGFDGVDGLRERILGFDL